jgi:RHS repeat-associated protein
MSPNRLARLALAAAVVFGALPASAQQDPFALPAGFLTQAAFSCGNVTVSGSAFVTSAGAGGEGHVVSNGNITLNGSSKIRGNASAGPGKTIKTTGSSQITGTRSYLDAAWACSPIDLATLGQALATTNDNVRIPKTSGGKNPLSGSSPPDLTLGGSETLVLPAGTYYFGKITIGGSSVLSVSGNVRILATGKVSLSGSSKVNDAGSPIAFRLFTSGTTFTLDGSARLKGFVYASGAAAAVKVAGSGVFVGGLYGGQLTFDGSVTLTRDVVYVPPADPLVLAITESGQPLAEGALFARAVTPVVTTTGGVAPVTVSALLDGASWTSGTVISANGEHTLAVAATDSAVPPTQLSETRRFTIDTEGPSLSIVSPPPGAVVSTSPIVVTGTVSGATSLTLLGGQVVLQEGGVFSAPVPLVEGTNPLRLVARDAAGNETSRDLPVVLDTLPPVVSLTSPSPGSCLAAGTTLTVAGRYIDAHPRPAGAPEGPAVSLTLTLPSGAATPIPAGVEATGAFTGSLPIPEGTEGSATLLATATDALGNVSRVLSSLRLDSAAPEVSISSDGAPFPGSGTGAAPPPGAIPTFVNRALAARALVRDGAAAAPAATLTLDGQAYAEGTPIAAEGNHLLVARVTDCAGHESAAYAFFSVDTTAPALLATVPTENALLKEPVTTFTGTASADVATVTVGGQSVTPTPGADSTTFSLAPFAWREGHNTVVVELVDRAGNRASFTRTFQVKTTGPVVEILLGGVPLGTGKTFFAPVTPEIRTNEPLSGSGAATLTTTLDGAPYALGTPIAAAGPHTLTASVVDAAGTLASAEASFTIDTSGGPSVVITSPVDGQTLPGPTVDVSGTVSAAPSAGPAAVRVNGRGAVVSVAGGTWTLAGLPLEPDAPNDIVAVAVDALGRSTSAVVQVLVRSDGPKLVLLSPAEGTRTNRRRIDVVGAVVGGPSSTADGLVHAGALSATIDATGSFRLLDVPLADGASTLSVTAVDAQGRTGEAHVTVASDTTAPTVSFVVDGQSLEEGAAFAGPMTVTVSVSDEGGSLPAPRILLNGAAIPSAGETTEVPVPEAGGWVLSVVAVDGAGNETRASRSFVVGGGGCELSDVRPSAGSTTTEAKVTIVGRCGAARRVLVRVPQVEGGAPQEYTASVADGTFAAGDVPLPVVGKNVLELVCEGASGAPSTVVHRITRLSGDGPVVSISTPAPGAVVTSSSATVSGAVSDATADLWVNGTKVGAAARTGTAFAQPGVALTEGPNVLVARAVDVAGRTAEARVVLQRDSQAPRLTVVWPTSGARFGRRGDAPAVADVTGVVDLGSEPNLASVAVSSPAGSVVATVDPVTGAFRAPGLPLGDASGTVRVSVMATDSVGLTTTVPVDVEVDAAGPALRLDAPSDLARLTAASPSSIVVSGEAWASEGATVSVNGISLDPATLAWEPAAADGRRHVVFQCAIAAPTTDGPFGVIVRAEDLQKRSASTRRLLVRDTIAPSVAEVVPASGVTGVDANGLVLVLFSEEVSRESLTATNGFVVTREGQPEPIVGTFSVAGSAVAFVPGAALTPGATYRVVLGAGLSDLAGNPLEVPRESSFTVAPTLSGALPALDTPLPAVVCAAALELKGSAPAGANLRVSVGAVTVNAVADASGRFVLSVPLLANGFHDVSLRIVGRDGSLGPALYGLVRKDCSAPFVERAALDREAGRVDVRFSERMDPATVTLSATAGDGASVVLSLEDEPAVARPGTLALDADGRSVRIDLPSDADAWWREKAVRLRVQEPAADENGIPLSAPWVTTFLPGGGAGDLTGGFLSGEVYDDATGRPLDGADVRLYPSTAAIPGAGGTPDPPLESTATDARGRYGFFGDVAAGRYAIHLGKAGYVPALRRLPLAPATGAVPFDARLTPLAAPAAQRLDAAVGGSFEGPADLLLAVAPAAFATASSGTLAVRLTPLSAQGLPELLPLGWSPLAAADVTLETDSSTPVPLSQSSAFAPNAIHLTLPLPADVPPAAALVAVRHDVASGRWLTLGAVDRRAGAGSADVARIVLASTGAVAIVFADTEPAIAPPALSGAEGEPLTASALPSPVPPLTATLTLDPAVVSPTGRATARVVARSADGTTLWPSGLAVQAYLDEKLVLSGGGELYEAPFTADLLLTHHPLSPDEESGATAGTVGALSFAVSPSPKAAEVLLESGWENVRLYPFPESLERGSILGALGGTVTSPDGVELTLQEGALAESVSVEAKLLTAAELAGFPPPAGFDLLAAVRISLSGRTLARAATLSVPLPADAPDDAAGEARLLLAQLVEQPIDARGAFARLTGRATRIAGPRALAAPEASGSPLPLEGLLSEGTYLVLRAQAPLGFATGFVRIGQGNGLALSRVTTPTLGTADLSRPGGRYAIPVPAGDNRDVFALHPQLDEAATGRIASLAPSAVAALDLLVKPVGPHVTSVQPGDNATSQPIGSSLVVQFSEPIDPASVVPGLLTAELLGDDGAATGAFFNGTLTLQPGGATLVFQPTHPLPPGRRIRGRLTSGVRDVGGTPYEGALPYHWSFTTKKELNPGGQIDLAKIRLLLPENGTARVVGAAGAIPNGWSVSASVENVRPSPACPETSTNVDTTGAFSIVAGCASTPVSLSSRVFLRALDSAGNITVLPLGPYVTADGLGFVTQPGEKAVYTTPEGVEVTVPAGAFDEAKVVRVANLDPAGIGVQAPAGMRYGAYVEVDFDGTAKETLRVRIPAPSDARIGSLTFAGTPVDVVWGRALKLLDLGSIVDGGNGTRLISTHEEDQPADPASGSNLLQSTGTVRALDTQLPRNLIKTSFLEFQARANCAFLLESGAELSAMVVDPGAGGITAQSWVLYNLYADQLLYYPLAFDWSGKAILPVVVGSPIELVQRNVSTGWILAQQQFDPYQSGSGSYGATLTMESDGGAPRLIDARPFAFSRFDALPAKDSPEACLRLSLELQGCATSAGQVKLTNADGFSFAKDTRVELFNVSAGYSHAGPIRDASQPFELTLAAKQGEEILAIVSPGDIDADQLSSLTFDFDRAPTNVTDKARLLVLTDCGEAKSSSCGSNVVPVSTEIEGTTVVAQLEGALSRGHLFRVTLDVAQLKGAGGQAKAYQGPSEFYFVTRAILGEPIGSSGSSILGSDPARDLLKMGGLLLVGSSSGELVAVDVSSPDRPVLWARSSGAADQIRAFATDGHGRLFYNALHGASWGVEAVRIEDVRDGRTAGGFAPTPGGVKIAFAVGSTQGLLASEFTSFAGSLPAGTPTAMDVLVEDEKSEPAELKDFYESRVVGSTLEELPRDSFGIYTFGIPLDLNTNGRRVPVEGACAGERAWYRYQRATVANLTTGETWSFDVENEWPGGDGDGTLPKEATAVLRARRGDLLQVRYNLRTYGYVAIVGSGITVVDLNRMYRTAVSGGSHQASGSECGRRLAKYEGSELNLGSGGSDAGNSGIASTPSVAVLGRTGSILPTGPVRGAQSIDAFSPLLFHGAVHAQAPASQPGQISAEALNLVASYPGARLRDVAVAPDAAYWENGEQLYRDLAFYTLGPQGVAVFDVSSRTLSLIGRFSVPGHVAWHVQYDRLSNRLYVGGTDDEGSVIDAFDVSRADGGPRADGTDPRLLLTVRAPWDTNHIAIDESGNGLLYTWDNGAGALGALSIPVGDPEFVFMGIFRDEGDEDPATRNAVSRAAGGQGSYLVPLGIPTRSRAADETNVEKRIKDERKATALFKVRVALPGGLGETVDAKVQTLRALPDLRNLGKENVGAAVALPGGAGWPERDVPIKLRRLSNAGVSESDPNGRTSVAFSLYESVEAVALLSDPRARAGYEFQTGDGMATEKEQCRRCERPSFTPESDVVELLAGGPWTRAFLTGTAAAFFASQGDNYRAPSGAAELIGWADEVPSPAQVSLAEPAQSPAVWRAEAGASVALTAGEALLETTDLSVKGRGVGFAFDRTYRSGMLGYSPLGAAPWTSSLFAHLRFVSLVGEEEARTLVEYHDGSGHVFPFVTAGDEACPEGLEEADRLCVPKGLYVQLESLGEKGYRLIGRNHDALYFDLGGNLAAVSDRHRQDEGDPVKQGSTLQLFRDSFGQLVAAEDDLGRGYRFTYEEAPSSPKYGLLSTLVDFDARRLTFNFDGTRRLESVELPEVEAGLPVVSYQYSSTPIAATAPHHGADFSPLKLESYRLPGAVTPRIRFVYEGASARVKQVGVAEVLGTWTIDPPGSAAPASIVRISAPEGLTSEYTLESGRVTGLNHLNLEVAKGAPAVLQSVSSTIKYHPSGDGRVESIVRGDGGRSVYAYPDDGGARIHRSKRLNISSVTDHGDDGSVVTRFPAYSVDNLPEETVDGEERRIKHAVPERNGSKDFGFLAEAVSGQSTFDAFGRPTSVKSGVGAEETALGLEYWEDARGTSGAGFLWAATRGGVSETYYYDARGNLESQRTSHGSRSKARYDSWDRPVEETIGLSDDPQKSAPSTVQRRYFLNGLLEWEKRTQKRSDGTTRLIQTTYSYNDRGQILTIKRDGLAAETAGGPSDATGTTTYTYDPSTGLLTDVLSPAGITTHLEYDTAGRVKSARTGGSAERMIGYDELGRPAWAHDGDQGQWTGIYDKLGRLETESHPTGARVSRLFDKAGGLKSEDVRDSQDPSLVLSSMTAHVTSFGAVDSFAQRQSEGLSLDVARSFDTGGRFKRQTSSGRLDAELTYETETGRVASVADATSKAVLRYDSDGSPWPSALDSYESGATCGAGVPTTSSRLERDALGRVRSESSTDGTRTAIDYDEEGRPLSITSGAGSTTTYSWDSAGALVAVTRPDGRGATRYGYDLDGRLRARSAIASSGQSFDVTYDYDSSGRLWHVQRAGQPVETFEYYPDDVVHEHRRRDGTVVTFGYDAANRPTGATPAAPSGPGSVIVDGGQGYEWDALSRLLASRRLTSSGTNARTSVAYSDLDQAGRPKNEVVGTRNALTRTYDVFGRTVSLGLPVGIGANQGLDYLRHYEGCSKRVLSLTAPTGPSSIGATWAWAGDGRLLGITTNGPLKTAHRFGYIGGPGAQPDIPMGASPAKWRLGTLTVGSAGTTDVALALPLGEGDSNVWGQFQYGYRIGDNAKLGRLVSPAGNDMSVLSSQGWAWGVDGASRLTGAMAGKGSLTGVAAGSAADAFERFQYHYGSADQVERLAREVAGEDVGQATGAEGRPLSRTVDGTQLGGEFSYDGEGRRTEDDRFTYRWHWFGKLAEVRVKETWPPKRPGGDPVVSPWAGHLVKWEYDALGRTFSRTHLGRLPEGLTDDCARPYIERREFLWEGGNLLGEAGYGPGPEGACSESTGAIRWRKSYVPGASGLDDQVQLRVESYGAGSEVTSDKIYSYIRDEMQSVLALVEERAGADTTKPPSPLRYLYTPFGEAHAEVGPEVRRARFDDMLASLGSQTQVVADTAHLAGGVTIDFSLPIDTATLVGGVLVERRLADGAWGALTAQELALGRGNEPERLLLLPLAGWQLGTTYRIRLTAELRDESGRSASNVPVLELAFPPPVPEGQVGSISFGFEKVFPVEYESALASGETANAAFPGGQNLGWQGHWVDPVTGLDMVRARVYDPRTAAWLTSDPLEDVDSPNLYGYVAGRPHEATDPWGLAVSVTKKGVMIASEELLHSPIEHFSWDWAAEHPDQFYALLTKRGGMNELEAGKLMADNGVMPGGQAGREFFVRQVSRDSRQLEDDATELWTSGMLGLGVDRAVTAAGRKVAATVAERQLAKEAAKRGGTPRINLADPRPSSPAPAAPVGTSSKGNYRPRFIAASETPADDEVHHTLFQKYATEFRSIGVNIHEERFLRGVNELVHRQVTKRVARLERQLNRRLTTDEVLDLAAKFDAEYGTQFVHRTPPARTERP